MRPRSFAALTLLAAAVALAGALAARPSPTRTGVQKIGHVIVIMQENRSFDSYFGTFPGADGIAHAICVPNGIGSCVRPYHETRDRSGGGAHGPLAGMQDVAGGKMNGFIRVTFGWLIKRCKRTPKAKGCAILRRQGLMGYYDSRELRNYWTYAKSFVLSDRMFEPNWGWSLPAHLWLVSGWSARCMLPTDPSTCTSSLDGPTNGPSSPLARHPPGPI